MLTNPLAEEQRAMQPWFLIEAMSTGSAFLRTKNGSYLPWGKLLMKIGDDDEEDHIADLASWSFSSPLNEQNPYVASL